MNYGIIMGESLPVVFSVEDVQHIQEKENPALGQI